MGIKENRKKQMRKIELRPKKIFLISLLIALGIFGGFALRIQEAEAEISFVDSAFNSSSPNTKTSVDISGIGIQAGDLILVAAAVGDSANNGMAAPEQGGYSRVPGVAASLYANDTNDTNLDLYYKIADGTETTVSFAAVGGTNASNAAIVMVFRGVDATTPFDTNANTATGTDTSNADPPSHDWSGTSGVWTVIAVSTGHTGGATATFTFPTGYTTNAAQRAHNDTRDVLVGMGYNTSPADPENPDAFSAANIGTASNNSWAAVTMSLKPSSPTITVASSTAQPSEAYSPETGIMIGSASIVRSTGTGQVTVVTLKETGTINANSYIENVKLWLSDDDSLGGDEQLGSTTIFDGSEECTFTETFDVTTTTKYLIVELDVKSGVTGEPSLEIQVKDITTTDNKSGIPCDIEGTTTVKVLPTITQNAYRWRNDDGSDVNSNTDIADTNASIYNVKIGERLTVHMQILVESAAASDKVYLLQYDVDQFGDFYDVTSSTPISYCLGRAGSNNDTIDSTGRACGTIGGKTWANGAWYENTGLTDKLSIAVDNYTELAFVVETSNALEGKVYRLRLYNQTDNKILTYSQYPTLTVVASGNNIRRYSKDRVNALDDGAPDLRYYLDDNGYSDVADYDDVRDED